MRMFPPLNLGEESLIIHGGAQYLHLVLLRGPIWQYLGIICGAEY